MGACYWIEYKRKWYGCDDCLKAYQRFMWCAMVYTLVDPEGGE